MSAADEVVQALRKEISELRSRVEELGHENNDLRSICITNDIDCEEALAVLRHRRYVARLCHEHPIGEAATASDAMCSAFFTNAKNSKLL